MKGALLFGSVVEAGESNVQPTSFTDPTSSFVVSQEGAQTMVSRVAVLQAVQVGDVKSDFSRSIRKFTSLCLTVPPALLPPPGSEATLRIVSQLESLLVLT